jgi:hypothetical protein
MSYINAILNIEEMQWNVIGEDIGENALDIRMGFCTNKTEIVKFDNLKFGFKLYQKNILLQEINFPREGYSYVSTDEKFSESIRVYLSVAQKYKILFWGENSGKYSEKEFKFKMFDPYIKENIQDKRLDICKSCDRYTKLTKTCKECMCFMPLKVMFKKVHCPLSKW